MRPHSVRKDKSEESDRKEPGTRHLGIAKFDYASARRGYWAKLRNGDGREVVITDYPTSLLHMLKAGVLTGLARADAEALLRLDSPARTD